MTQTKTQQTRTRWSNGWQAAIAVDPDGTPAMTAQQAREQIEHAAQAVMPDALAATIAPIDWSDGGIEPGGEGLWLVPIPAAWVRVLRAQGAIEIGGVSIEMP